LKSPIKMPLEMQKRNKLFLNSLDFGDIFEKKFFLKNRHIRHEIMSMSIQFRLIVLQN
jgi:hypothetical protein